jgi:hypothetical protein
MSLKYSIAVRNARLDAVESTIGTAALLQLFTGSAPANCAAADSGTKLIEITLPSDWMAAASAGAKAKAGTWSGSVIAAGDAGYFRIKDSTGTDCGIQGTVTATGGGGDLTLDNITLAIGQVLTEATFTLTAGNP